MDRNDVIEECIAAVEGLNEQCADLLEAAAEGEQLQHRQHRQAYTQVIQRLESLREGAYDWPAVRPERLQLLLLDRVETFLQNEESTAIRAEFGLDDSLHLITWVKEQLKVNAEVRASFLLP